jgi:hypothetical protein
MYHNPVPSPQMKNFSHKKGPGTINDFTLK